MHNSIFTEESKGMRHQYYLIKVALLLLLLSEKFLNIFILGGKKSEESTIALGDIISSTLVTKQNLYNVNYLTRFLALIHRQKKDLRDA